MKKLYCGDCNNYLMGSDGDCHNCPCGWKQPDDTRDNVSYDDMVDELEDLRSQVELLRADATRYDWIRKHIKEEVYQRPDEYVGVKTKYVLPLLMAYAEFCGQISLDQAIDFKIEESRGDKR